ncbi:hypothetical protein [Mesorhizobium sp. B2-3-6]|uniref:hypothetical protein n=1 Tax=Mesorhizobium sp. B2-3-6 TaxID=2589957 RepID=UPI0011277371|nr:hypothetical protein [Mesorhizobium sp. B2-3-6]TPM19753.1 hypothetical protein FJ953_15225 [Mesorhizobium sp. B2-3-6]
MPKRNRVTPAPSVIDRDWPYQVALPDDICTDRNLTMITKFCQDIGVKPQIRRVQAIWPNGKYEDYRIHCFSDPAAAKAFLDHFAGDVFDSKRDREGGKIRGVWRRTGEYKRILDLGPLSVPEILRN